MAVSIAEQIARKVRSRLQAISTGSGYESTASQVIRPKRIETATPKDYTIAVTQDTITENAGLSCPGNPPAIAWDMPFTITGILRPSENDSTPIDTYKNQFWADCVKALNTGSNWWNWDTLAINSTISQVEDYSDGEGDAGFKLTLTVTFRTSENDPFTQR